MSIFEYNEELLIKNERSIAMEQGLQRGMAQGLQRGIAQGLQRGMAQGLQRGIAKKLIDQVCIKLKKKKDLSTIAAELETNIDDIQKIYAIACNYAPDYDTQIIFQKLFESDEYYQNTN